MLFNMLGAIEAYRDNAGYRIYMIRNDGVWSSNLSCGTT
jgi:hypothetical protein